MVLESQYLGAYIVQTEEKDAWVRLQAEKCSEGVRDLAKVPKRNPQTAYAGLETLLQLKWYYLQRTVPGVGYLMKLIDLALKEEFFLTLFRGEEMDNDTRELVIVFEK